MSSRADSNNRTAPSVGSLLTDVLDRRAEETPKEIAYRFLTDGEESEVTIEFGTLARLARAVAGGLLRAGTTGKPVLLAEPAGLSFIVGLFACWYAGAIAVPVYPPKGSRHRRRFEAILHDSGATFAIGAPPQRTIPELVFLDADELALGTPFDGRTTEGELPCLLQYTSGSTADPKGVMIHHRNLQSHLGSLEEIYLQLGVKKSLSWLPPYHDMGLILKLLMAVHSGLETTLLTPDHFIQKPLRWLRAISKYRADFSGGPNFAFELCLRTISDDDLADLDLSSWKAAPCGAERVQVDTLRRFVRRFSACGFDPSAFLPGYGLAEATLTVTACSKGSQQRISSHPTAGTHVSCGTPIQGTEIRIADPETHATLLDGEIGEIRVKGPGVASGYWNRPEATAATFLPNGELRTGDRGYLEDGELHVVGRIKDLIILGGLNFAPEDIESTLLSAFPEFTTSAAFSTESENQEVVVLAIESARLSPGEMEDRRVEIREKIVEALEISLDRIVFVRNGTLPRTTSGKIRRSASREAYEAGNLAIFHDEPVESRALSTPALDHICRAVEQITGRPGVKASDDLISIGMSSIEATRLSAILRANTGVDISHADLFSTTSFGHLAELISSRTPAPIDQVEPGSGSGSGLLTHSQERMWFLHQLDPESAAYHVFGALELTGPLDLDALEKAYTALLERHAILRSRHRVAHGQPVALISDSPSPSIEQITVPEPEGALHDFALRPFDLVNSDPIRALLIHSEDDRKVLGICAHHIASDGWSMRLIVRDLEAYYRAYREESPLPPAVTGPDYLDYAAWHRTWIDGGAADRQIAYWKERLRGHSGVMELATDFPRPVRTSSVGGAVETKLSSTLAESIADLAKKKRVTPFMVQLAAFLLLLRRHGSDDDPVVAVPVANRNHAVAGEIVGTLVNTLPFRLPLDPDETFHELLERIREASFEMQANQDAPFERIIDAVRPDRVRDRSPLAQVMFDHQEIPVVNDWSGGLECRPYLAHRGAVQFDLSLLVFALSDHQQIVIEYRSDLYLRETAERMLARYISTLEAICAAPEQAIRDIDCQSDLDRDDALGATPVRGGFLGKTTPSLIAATCKRLPESTALVCEDSTLTYAEIESRSSALAAELQARGVEFGDRVAVLLERSISLPVALLAVWKSGAAYVPLDAANPPERLALVLEDQTPLHVLVSPSLVERLPENTKHFVLEESMLQSSARLVFKAADPETTAYIIYTSGSTGRPKGVVISHGALANFLLSMQEQPGLREGERLLAVTTVSFDISTLELFLPLITGATVDLVPGRTSRDPAALLARVIETKPDIMQATPATWRMLIEAGWEGSLNMTILCGGEALDLPLAEQLVTRGRETWNLYGPTETTVWSSIWKVPANPEAIRIGDPIANTGLHIVGDDDNPAPPGVPGHLLISGAGLAEGYWNNAELTDAAFFKAPAFGDLRLYRTGDIARWHADGSLECLGRSDGQVKIRGFRVELGEVDTALLSHIAVAEAAAVVHADRLVAWYRPSFQILDPAEIIDYLRERLPDYMVPAPLVPIDEMPLTSSGKIDRKALAARTLPTESPNPSKKPTGALEAELAEIWADVLACPSVGPDDDFFHLGGHSLLAAKLVAEASRRLGVTVALDWLFDRPTPAGMAARIREDAAPDLATPRLIPLQQKIGGNPLFWIHTLVDGGMGLLPYRDTSRLLHDVTDSYGIAEGTEGFSTIAEMAAAHIERIREKRPHGPYRIAGFCFGGNLAAEIASQLMDEGETVEILVLLEASPPNSGPSAAQFLNPATWYRIVRRFPSRLLSIFKRDSAGALRRIQMKRRAAADLVQPGIPNLRAVLDIDVLDQESQERALRHWEALHHHTPRLPAAERIVLIRAADEGWLPRSPTLGWKSPVRIETLTVPGRHEEFLRHHSAEDVAAIMRDLLAP